MDYCKCHSGKTYCVDCMETEIDELRAEVNSFKHAAEVCNEAHDKAEKQVKVLRDALDGINGEVFATCGQVLEPDRYFRIRDLSCTAYKTEAPKATEE